MQPDSRLATTKRLPRRDFLLIPALSVLTLVVMALFGEVASRQVFYESGSERCSTVAPSGVQVMRPNCTSSRKAAEGPETTNAYNDCGYRAPQPCHQRTPNALRIAVMGASTAQGMKVPYEQTFSALVSARLGEECGRPVELQNMGIPGANLLDIYRRVPEALEMRPELLMVVLSPLELRSLITQEQLAARDAPAAQPRNAVPPPPDTTPAAKSLVARLSDLAYESHILIAAQHFLFEDSATYDRLYLLHGDEADYLRLPINRMWDDRLHTVDVLLAGMAKRAQEAGVPMLVALAPARIQTTLLDPRLRPPGVDPAEIGRRLAAIAQAHGIGFIDLLSGFSPTDDPGGKFYPVDGHLNAAGQAVIAATLEKRLLATPVFAGCNRS